MLRYSNVGLFITFSRACKRLPPWTLLAVSTRFLLGVLIKIELCPLFISLKRNIWSSFSGCHWCVAVVSDSSTADRIQSSTLCDWFTNSFHTKWNVGCQDGGRRCRNDWPKLDCTRTVSWILEFSLLRSDAFFMVCVVEREKAYEFVFSFFFWARFKRWFSCHLLFPRLISTSSSAHGPGICRRWLSSGKFSFSKSSFLWNFYLDAAVQTSAHFRLVFLVATTAARQLNDFRVLINVIYRKYSEQHWISTSVSVFYFEKAWFHAPPFVKACRRAITFSTISAIWCSSTVFFMYNTLYEAKL